MDKTRHPQSQCADWLRKSSTGEFEVAHALIAARAITGMISFMYTWHRDKDVLPDAELTDVMAAIAMRSWVPIGPERPAKSSRKIKDSR